MGIVSSLKNFAESSKRVLILAKKPDFKEYRAMAKVTAIGIVLIGIIGFIVFLVFTYTAVGR